MPSDARLLAVAHQRRALHTATLRAGVRQLLDTAALDDDPFASDPPAPAAPLQPRLPNNALEDPSLVPPGAADSSGGLSTAATAALIVGVIVLAVSLCLAVACCTPQARPLRAKTKQLGSSAWTRHVTPLTSAITPQRRSRPPQAPLQGAAAPDKAARVASTPATLVPAPTPDNYVGHSMYRPPLADFPSTGGGVAAGHAPLPPQRASCPDSTRVQHTAPKAARQHQGWRVPGANGVHGPVSNGWHHKSKQQADAHPFEPCPQPMWPQTGYAAPIRSDPRAQFDALGGDDFELPLPPAAPPPQLQCSPETAKPTRVESLPYANRWAHDRLQSEVKVPLGPPHIMQMLPHATQSAKRSAASQHRRSSAGPAVPQQAERKPAGVADGAPRQAHVQQRTPLHGLLGTSGNAGPALLARPAEARVPTASSAPPERASRLYVPPPPTQAPIWSRQEHAAGSVEQHFDRVQEWRPPPRAARAPARHAPPQESAARMPDWAQTTTESGGTSMRALDGGSDCDARTTETQWSVPHVTGAGWPTPFIYGPATASSVRYGLGSTWRCLPLS